MLAAEEQVHTPPSWGPRALDEKRETRRKHQDEVASRRDQWIQSNRYFYERLKRVLQFIVEPGRRVLDIRCQTGHLLRSVQPSRGVGVEIGDVMVASARRQHPDLEFVKSDPEVVNLREQFDYVLFNHIFDTVDILQALERIQEH